MTDTPDADLLEQYARENSGAAFTMLVERHIGLVHSVALRHTANSQHAQDITQAVFIILARKAPLHRKTVLPGWLYHTARLTAANFQRAETSRIRREQEAFMQSTIQETAPDALWAELSPLLDEAMSRLGTPDRDALVLRYFQNKSLSEVGASMGLEERTAQKRVTRALEKLRKIFAQNGVTLSGAAIASAVSANSVQAAPVGLAAIISTAALSGTTLTTAALIAATKAIAMTILQKALVTAAFVVTVGAGIYEAHQNSQLRGQNQTLQQQQASLADQLAQLQRERNGAADQLAALLAENEQPKSNSNETELLKLRGEVTALRNAANDPTDAAAKAWLAKVNKLKQRLADTPSASIPEFQFLTEQDWLDAASGKLDTDADYRQAFASLRSDGENKFASMLQPALTQYMQANNKQFPTDLSQLQPYFTSSVDDAALQRWEIAPASTLPNMSLGGGSVITEKAAVDDMFDVRTAIGSSGYGSTDFLESEIGNTLKPVYAAYLNANGPISANFDGSQLLSYATTPEQQAAVQKLMEQKALKK
jgi:RNA polymerase sigma factor (sigma-70 family)